MRDNNIPKAARCLYNLRTQEKITAGVLAERMNVSRSFIMDIEHGRVDITEQLESDFIRSVNDIVAAYS